MKHFQALLFLILLTAFPIAASVKEGARVEQGNLILENVPETPAAVAERLRLRQEFRSAGFLDWTPTGEGMLIATRFGAVSQIHRVAMPLGARRQLTFSAEPLRSAVAQPGGNGFVYTKDDGGDEYYQLYFHDMKTGKALRRLHLMETSTGKALPAPSLSYGQVGNREFNPRGDQFAFTFAGTTGPADVFVWNLRDRSLTRWSESEVAGIDPAMLADPELVRFTSFDKRKISAFLYRPKLEGKLPVIIHIHGGPEAQFRPTFSPRGPVMSGLELGFAVIAPNVRGSTGYGKTFVALDNGMKREDAVKDIGALLDWIADQPFLDKDRVVLHGGSYGGYMVNASMVHFPDRLKACISIVAISDFNSFLKNTAEYRRDLRRAEYGDERDPKMAAFLKRIAPLARADRITAPMFIIHGANDPRVPVTEAEQLFSALKAKGEKPWLMIAKDEGHGFQKQANIIRMEEAMTLFLEHVVLGEEGRSGAALAH